MVTQTDGYLVIDMIRTANHTWPVGERKPSPSEVYLTSDLEQRVCVISINRIRTCNLLLIGAPCTHCAIRSPKTLDVA